MLRHWARKGHCKFSILCATNTTFSTSNGKSIVNLRAELSVSSVTDLGNNCWLLPPSQSWYIRERMLPGTPLEISNKRIFSTSSSVSWSYTDQDSHPSNKKIIAGNFWVYPSPGSGSVGSTDFSVQARLSLTVVLETTIYICNKKAISPRCWKFHQVIVYLNSLSFTMY